MCRSSCTLKGLECFETNRFDLPSELISPMAWVNWNGVPTRVSVKKFVSSAQSCRNHKVFRRPGVRLRSGFSVTVIAEYWPAIDGGVEIREAIQRYCRAM